MKTCVICQANQSELFCTIVNSAESSKVWKVLRCSDCGYGWTTPSIDEKDLAAYYPPSYLGDTHRRMNDYLSGRLEGTRSWQRELEKAVLVQHYTPNGRILDVGCSNCSFLLALDPQKWERIGVEYIQEVLEVVKSYDPSIELHHGDIHSLELEENSLDAITYWHVFEHLRDPRGVLSRTFRLLKPGGHVFIRVPRFDHWQPKAFGRYWYPLDVPRHLHHFSKRALEILLQESGASEVATAASAKRDNFHHLKHSALRWSEQRLSSRIPYYLLKPVLLLISQAERLAGKPVILTMVARKPLS